MKNIFDQLKNANLGDLGNTLGSVLGGGMGGNNQQAPQNQGNVGAANQQNSQSSSLGGVGGLLGSAAVGGILGALFTGKGVKKVAEGALKVGGTAAVGALAWKFYQKWSQGNQTEQSGTNPQYNQNSVGQCSVQETGNQYNQQALPPADSAALLLIEAMVYAARADGHIDDEEKANIHNAVEALLPNREMIEIVDGFLQKPIDPMALASRVQNKEEGYDLYRLSCAAVNIDSFMERSYLDGLANALRLTEQEKNQLEQEALAAQQQGA